MLVRGHNCGASGCCFSCQNQAIRLCNDGSPLARASVWAENKADKESLSSITILGNNVLGNNRANRPIFL